MHGGTPYGYLRLTKVIGEETLSRLVGAAQEDVSRWLVELRDAGVYSVDDDGCVYSRRMVRDEALRSKRAEAGAKGGNPAFRKGEKNPYYSEPSPALIDYESDNQEDKQKDKQEAKQKISPSSSSSSSKICRPSVDEVAGYCLERGNNVDPQRFIDFYASKGWMIGKNAMRDWRAAVRTWERKSPDGVSAADNVEALAAKLRRGGNGHH